MTELYKYAPSIVLNKYKRREDGRTLPIEIFGSNSKQGTSIYVDPINALFDVGVTYQTIGQLNDQMDVIMISHAHSDHLHWPTLVSLLNAHPMIMVLLPYFIDIPPEYAFISRHVITVYDLQPVDLVLRSGLEINVMPLQMPHGKEMSFSYSIRFQDANLLFSTDLSSTEHLPSLVTYNIIMIETNYDADEFVSPNGSGGAVAHLSVQDAMQYAMSHLDEYGKMIPLHFGPTMLNFNQLH